MNVLIYIGMLLSSAVKQRTGVKKFKKSIERKYVKEHIENGLRQNNYCTFTIRNKQWNRVTVVII